MTSEETQPRFSSPQTEAFLRLLRVSDQLNRAFQQRLRPYKLTHPQYNVLRILRGACPSGLTCSAIGRSMITAVPDITRLLTRLQSRRLVSQHRDSADRRIVWTRITARGQALLRSLDPVVEQAPKEMLHPLSAAEVRELNRLLQSISAPTAALDTNAHLRASMRDSPASEHVFCPSGLGSGSRENRIESHDSSARSATQQRRVSPPTHRQE